MTEAAGDRVVEGGLGVRFPGDPRPAQRPVSPGRERMRRDVLAGLSAPVKELSPKYFYDARGSELFEEITGLPEYYPTRTELALLRSFVPAWLATLGPRSLVELGAGSARKTRVILDAMVRLGEGRVYVPLDVSATFLEGTARALRGEYPGLRVIPRVADLTDPIDAGKVPRPLVVAFLGSTIGNFRRRGAVEILRNAGGLLSSGDRLLLGVDLRPGPGKPRAVLEAAYNDSRGVTAEFNLNVLRVLNRQLGSDFDLEAFRHLAFYDDEAARIEMHLVSERDQLVRIPGAPPVAFTRGETVRTEISCKYDRPEVESLFREAGLAIEHWVPDTRDRYALVVGRPS